MLRGTARRTAVQLATSSEDIGGSLDANGEVETAEVRGQALARHWETLLGLVAEVALSAVIACRRDRKGASAASRPDQDAR